MKKSFQEINDHIEELNLQSGIYSINCTVLKDFDVYIHLNVGIKNTEGERYYIVHSLKMNGVNESDYEINKLETFLNQ